MFGDKLKPIRPFLDKFFNWTNNAKWWHFWNPGTGFSGGIICGVIAFILFYIIF